MLLGFIINTV